LVSLPVQRYDSYTVKPIVESIAMITRTTISSTKVNADRVRRILKDLKKYLHVLYRVLKLGKGDCLDIKK
jgi:hypothetical protein